MFLLGTLELGGSEKKTVNLARRLAGRGYPIHVAYLRKPDPLRESLGDVPVVNLGQAGKYSFRAVRKLKAYVREHGIATIVTINLYPLLYAMPARQSLSGKDGRILASVNTSELMSTKDRIAMTLYARLLARSSAVVFGSERQRDDWTGRYRLDPVRSSVIYNGVDGDYFDPETPEQGSHVDRVALGIPAETPVIVCVGKLRPEKAHRNLVEALHRLQTESGLDAVLLIVGDGEERRGIERAAERLKLGGRVKMIGNVDDVRPYLRIADVFALPSVAVETFSNAALEAAAMGVPVVISDVGGSAEMFEGQHAVRIFPRNDVSALAAALEDIIVNTASNPSARSGIRRATLERYSLPRMDEMWISAIWGGEKEDLIDAP